MMMKFKRHVTAFLAMTIVFLLFALCSMLSAPVAFGAALVVPDAASEIKNTPAGNIAATDVQGAINELDTEKEPANSNIQSHIGAANPHSGSAASGANSDITALSGITTPLSISQGGNGNTQGSGLLNINRLMIGATDWSMNALGQTTWLNAGFGTTAGTSPSKSGSSNHPGITAITSSVAADSGYRYLTTIISFLLAGGETTEFIFMPVTTTNTVVRLGFMDSGSSAAVVDAVNINITATTLTGKTSAASSASTTGTTYTVSESTWYRAKIVVNANATRVDFYLYAANGSLLWTDYLTTNIPTTAGQETGHGVIAYNTGTSAVEIIDMDYMSLYINRDLVR